MNKIVRAQKLKLALVENIHEGMRFPLNEGRQVIGRRQDASIPVDDTKVSRDHALVDYRNGYFYLVDLGSTNGTYVNGKRVNHAIRINLGDQLRFGSSKFRVELLKNCQIEKKAQWADPTCVDLKVSAHSSQPKFKAERRSASREVARVLSQSLPNMIKGADSDAAKKRNGILMLVLLCSILVLSAILTGFEGITSV